MDPTTQASVTATIEARTNFIRLDADRIEPRLGTVRSTTQHAAEHFARPSTSMYTILLAWYICAPSVSYNSAVRCVLDERVTLRLRACCSRLLSTCPALSKPQQVRRLSAPGLLPEDAISRTMGPVDASAYH